jgi:putative flippase GtrA
VTLVRDLYERFRHLIHEAAKFGVVGIVGVFITNAVYDLLHSRYHVGPVTSTTVATIIATAVSFVANRYWSFRHRERTGVARETMTFFVLNGIGLLIQDAVVAFNFYILGNQHDRLAGFIALNLGIALATLFRFWSYRRWVWVAPSDDDPSPLRQPEPAGPPRPTRVAAWDRAPGDDPAGQEAGLLHMNGHANGHANGRAGRDRATRPGPQPLDR